MLTCAKFGLIYFTIEFTDWLKKEFSRRFVMYQIHIWLWQCRNYIFIRVRSNSNAWYRSFCYEIKEKQSNFFCCFSSNVFKIGIDFCALYVFIKTRMKKKSFTFKLYISIVKIPIKLYINILFRDESAQYELFTHMHFSSNIACYFEAYQSFEIVSDHIS